VRLFVESEVGRLRARLVIGGELVRSVESLSCVTCRKSYMSAFGDARCEISDVAERVLRGC
jgi:hypothetical protein